MNCPKCGKILIKKNNKGNGNGPNGGYLSVSETMMDCIEIYDPDISYWECSDCGLRVYIGED